MKFQLKLMSISMSVIFILLIACGGGGDNPGTGGDTPDSGPVDTTFGTNGLTITDINNRSNTISAMAVLPDDKIIVTGDYQSSTDPDIVIAKYDKDGNLDTGFGTNGYTIHTVSSTIESAQAVTILSDGRIVVSGYKYNSGYSRRIVCFKSDGSIDTSFGTNGVVEELSGSLFDIKALADGKFMVCGDTINSSTSSNAFIARYNSDGTRDNTFSTDGAHAFTLTGSTNRASRMVFHSDKIYIAGNGKNVSSDSAFSAIACFNMDGTADTAFGTNGILAVNVVTTKDDSFTAITINSENKIYVSGYRGDQGFGQFNIMCYNTDGSADTSFGSNGELVTSIASGSDSIEDLLILNDGSIFAGGLGSTMTDYEFAFLKFSPDGLPDSSFNSNGKLVYHACAKNDFCNAMAKQSTGKIIAAGFANNGSNNDFALLRLQAD